jgi:hypothetical protein
MTMSISNQGVSNQAVRNTDQLDMIMEAIEAALYYPSLKGISWDDELLPCADDTGFSSCSSLAASAISARSHSSISQRSSS